jgi:hypothetical protein
MAGFFSPFQGPPSNMKWLMRQNIFQRIFADNLSGLDISNAQAPK